MTQDGWRKPTPGLGVAEQHAQAGEQLTIPKNQALAAIKRVAAAIGVKPGDLLLLDTLVAFTQAQDWEEGRRPIVWASNDYLMEQTGFSLSTLKRHARRLAEHGLIAFKDSPNGKRWGHRDDQGFIMEAYGFDLAPLAARTQEFEMLHHHLKEERVLCQSMKRKITIARRTIRAKIELALQSALKGPWEDYLLRFQSLLARLPAGKLASEAWLELYDAFKALKEAVETTFKATERSADNARHIQDADIIQFKNMNPREAKTEPHILTTNQPKSVKSNRIDQLQKTARSDSTMPPGEETEPELADLRTSTEETKPEMDAVNIPVVMAACPEFAKYAHGVGGHVHTWNDLHAAAGKIRPMLGISLDGWNDAQSKLGPGVAAAALALITDKYETEEIQSPGGYLRGIVDKALAGELHLARSFYGRLSESRHS